MLLEWREGRDRRKIKTITDFAKKKLSDGFWGPLRSTVKRESLLKREKKGKSLAY